MVFSYTAVFSKTSDVSSDFNARFIAINRRGYSGSTDYSENEKRVLNSGSNEEKEAFLAARGQEILSFIDTFVRHNDVPISSEDRKTGGIILLRWSFGNYPVIAALSQVDSLPQERLGLLRNHLKSIVLYGRKCYRFPIFQIF
jgi:hypothetical protein